MSNALSLQYRLGSTEEWLAQLHAQLPSTLVKQQLTLSPEVGEGRISYLELQEGLFITFLDLSLSAPITLQRQAAPTNDYFILNFYLSAPTIEHESADRDGAGRVQASLGVKHHSVLLSSAMTDAQMVVPSGHPLSIFNITFSREWMMRNILGGAQPESVLMRQLSPHEPIFIFENMSYHANSTFAAIASQRASGMRIGLISNVMALLAQFFDSLSDREELVEPADVGDVELQGLMRARRAIEEQLDDAPTNEELAKLSGMSLAKFKRHFKKVLGKSPYQYSLAHRMERARELLEMHSHNVSEVGHRIGYSNMGQFSKIFKRHHGVLPSEIRRPT